MKLATLRKKAQKAHSCSGGRFRWGQPFGRPAVPHLGFLKSSYSQRGVCRCGECVVIHENA